MLNSGKQTARKTGGILFIPGQLHTIQYRNMNGDRYRIQGPSSYQASYTPYNTGI